MQYLTTTCNGAGDVIKTIFKTRLFWVGICASVVFDAFSWSTIMFVSCIPIIQLLLSFVAKAQSRIHVP